MIFHFSHRHIIHYILAFGSRNRGKSTAGIRTWTSRIQIQSVTATSTCYVCVCVRVWWTLRHGLSL